MDTPYKFCILGKDNTPKQMIVFSNNTENADSSIFNDKEREFIETNSIPIQFSNQQIHKDDSISIIKNKILKSIDFAVSYHELYLFSNIRKVHKNLQNILNLRSTN
jgi:hypothetical protein